MRLTLNKRPFPKERPRSTKSGVIYTPRKTKQAEKEIADAWRDTFGDRPPFEGPVSIRLDLYDDLAIIDVKAIVGADKSKLRGDIDNYAKTILDALNGVAFVDDRQIQELKVWKS